MTPLPPDDPEDRRLNALAAQLSRAAEAASGGAETSGAAVTSERSPPPLDAPTLHAALAAVTRHIQLRKSVRQKRHQAHLIAAIVTALFAIATALLGQSAGWAGYNLGVAYGLLIGGTLLAGGAGGLAIYLGIGEPEGLYG